jgi:hydrogenase maturation factor HypF (carbamoyltransferase family)
VPAIIAPAIIAPASGEILPVCEEVISARFHSGLAEAVAGRAGRLAEGAAFDTVALSGGCFQNAALFEAISRPVISAPNRRATSCRFGWAGCRH